MLVFPNAKINFGLHVTQKRTDGYHDIETVFFHVKGFRDVLEIIENNEGTEDTLNETGLATNSPTEENLVIKALKLMRKMHPIPPLKIHLHKNIPSGAGLGGGSSDAAFMLKLLNDQFKLNIPTKKLEEKASTLGADCAFFIREEPVLARGIGNEFSPVKISLNGLWLTVVVPPISLSTPVAYKNISPAKPEKEINSILKEPLEKWQLFLKNDFEKNAFDAYPELSAIKSKLYEHGALYASMSGSGSAIYGIFREEPRIEWPVNFVKWQGQIE